VPVEGHGVLAPQGVQSRLLYKQVVREQRFAFVHTDCRFLAVESVELTEATQLPLAVLQTGVEPAL
jgi:hypothetical protein